jgi:hypothetical protein
MRGCTIFGYVEVICPNSVRIRENTRNTIIFLSFKWHVSANILFLVLEKNKFDEKQAKREAEDQIATSSFFEDGDAESEDTNGGEGANGDRANSEETKNGEQTANGSNAGESSVAVE